MPSLSEIYSNTRKLTILAQTESFERKGFIFKENVRVTRLTLSDNTILTITESDSSIKAEYLGDKITGKNARTFMENRFPKVTLL